MRSVSPGCNRAVTMYRPTSSEQCTSAVQVESQSTMWVIPAPARRPLRRVWWISTTPEPFFSCSSAGNAA